MIDVRWSAASIETPRAAEIAGRRLALTPPRGDSRLRRGVRQSRSGTLAPGVGLQTDETPLEPGDLYTADEVFLTGTAAGIAPVGAIDGRTLPGAPGPFTRALDAAYRATWADPRYSVALADIEGRA